MMLRRTQWLSWWLIAWWSCGRLPTMHSWTFPITPSTTTTTATPPTIGRIRRYYQRPKSTTDLFSFSKATVRSFESSSNSNDPSHNRTRSKRRHVSSSSNSSDQEDDLETYRCNLKLANWANQCSHSKKPLPVKLKAARQALHLLRQMPHPDTVSYNTVLKALSKLSPAQIPVVMGDEKHATSTHTDAALVAHQLLREMAHLETQQSSQNQDWYDKLSDNLLEETELQQGPLRVRVQPNGRTYAAVMDAYSRAGNYVACRQLLQELQEKFNATGHVALQPNAIMYNTVLAAAAKSIGKPSTTTVAQPSKKSQSSLIEECWRLVQEMPEPPDVITHNNMLHILARCHKPRAAQDYLHHHIPKGMANGRSYTTVISAWSRVGRVREAHALLDEVVALSSLSRQVAPNAATYSSLLHAYAKCSLPNKAMLAHEVYTNMPRYCRNSIVTNAMLNVCASSFSYNSNNATTEQQDHETIWNLLETVYDQALESGQADSFTFGTVLKACASSPRDPDFCTRVFEQARRQGHVTAVVLLQFRDAVAPDVYETVTGGHDLLVGTIPYQWRCNVQGGR